MIVADAEVSDELSTMVDSVASIQSAASNLWDAQSLSFPLVPASQRKLQLQLASISEEEESDPCEAYLRGKMAALWTKIQEQAEIKDLSATPSTDRDAELLRAYDKENDAMVPMRK